MFAITPNTVDMDNAAQTDQVEDPTSILKQLHEMQEQMKQQQCQLNVMQAKLKKRKRTLIEREKACLEREQQSSANPTNQLENNNDQATQDDQQNDDSTSIANNNDNHEQDDSDYEPATKRPYAPLQPTINPYASPSKSGCPKIWMERYEFTTSNINWDDKKRIMFLPNHPQEEAAQWCNRCNIQEWPVLKETFIKEIQADSSSETDFLYLKYVHNKGNVMKFLQKKEKLANLAGIHPKQFIDNVLMNSNLPAENTTPLAHPVPQSISELKSLIQRIHCMKKTQTINNFVKPFHAQKFNAKPFNNSKNSSNKKPSSPCPECLKRGKTLYHWLSDCFHRQDKQPIKKRINVLAKTSQQSSEGNNLNLKAQSL